MTAHSCSTGLLNLNKISLKNTMKALKESNIKHTESFGVIVFTRDNLQFILLRESRVDLAIGDFCTSEDILNFYNELKLINLHGAFKEALSQFITIFIRRRQIKSVTVTQNITGIRSNFYEHGLTQGKFYNKHDKTIIDSVFQCSKCDEHHPAHLQLAVDEWSISLNVTDMEKLKKIPSRILVAAILNYSLLFSSDNIFIQLLSLLVVNIQAIVLLKIETNKNNNNPT